jgi:hypothetical protein
VAAKARHVCRSHAEFRGPATGTTPGSGEPMAFSNIIKPNRKFLYRPIQRRCCGLRAPKQPWQPTLQRRRALSSRTSMTIPTRTMKAAPSQRPPRFPPVSMRTSMRTVDGTTPTDRGPMRFPTMKRNRRGLWGCWHILAKALRLTRVDWTSCITSTTCSWEEGFISRRWTSHSGYSISEREQESGLLISRTHSPGLRSLERICRLYNPDGT